MDTFVSLQTLVSAIVGAAFGAVSAWLTRHLDRKHERERSREAARRELILEVRAAAVLHWDDPDALEHDPAFRRIRPDLSTEALAAFRKPRIAAVTQSGSRRFGPEELLDDLARLEREWELL